jgi:uncharacterized protein (DUF433 family)
VPCKVGGVPLVKGTRVPVDQVLASKDGGKCIEEIAYNFDLNPEDIRASAHSSIASSSASARNNLYGLDFERQAVRIILVLCGLGRLSGNRFPVDRKDHSWTNRN